jgi:hypothetical protein
MSVWLWLSGGAALVLVVIVVVFVICLNGRNTMDEAAAEPEQYSATNPPTGRPVSEPTEPIYSSLQYRDGCSWIGYTESGYVYDCGEGPITAVVN